MRLVRAMISKDDLQGGKVPEWERLKERLGSGITTVFAITVDSLLTHTSHTPYSLIPHRILNIPAWFAGVSDT